MDDGDSEAVTWEMGGIVLLVAIVTGSREPAMIAELTKLPVDFVGLVLELCHELRLWWSPLFFGLESTVREQGDDLEEVSAAMESVIEGFCMSWTSEAIEAVFHSSREHVQYGGVKDPWVTASDLEHLESAPKRPEWVN